MSGDYRSSELEAFNARVIAGQSSKKMGCITLLLIVVGALVGVRFAGAFLGELADRRHPERAVAREAVAAKMRQEEERTRLVEAQAGARKKDVRQVEEDKAIDREVRAEFLAHRTGETRAAIEAQLRDPSSAIYRSVIAIDGGMAFCGEVNGANGFGGYAGWRPFVVVGSTVSFAPTEEGAMADYFERSFDRWCRRGSKKDAVKF